MARTVVISALAGCCVAFMPTGGRADVTYVDVAEARGMHMVVRRPPSDWAGDDASTWAQLTQDTFGSGVAVGDYDRDGDLDVYILGTFGQGNRLLRNNISEGSPTFTDVTEPPLDDEGMSRSAQFVDLDGDGWLDLVLLNEEDALGVSYSKIFRNVGGSFVDVTETSCFYVPGFVHVGMGLADVDGDGRVDIFVSGYPFWIPSLPPMWESETHLFRNRGHFRFEDVAEEAGLQMVAGGGDRMSPVFLNLMGGAHPELFVAVDHGRDRLYRTLDGHAFEDVSLEVNIGHIGNGMGVAVGDVDGDLDLDIFVTKIFDEWELFGDGNALYVNAEASSGDVQFQESARERGVEHAYWGWGTEMVDVDDDGDLDLVAVNGFDDYIAWSLGESAPLYRSPGVLWLNDGRGAFERHTGTDVDLPDDSRALIAFDFDRDGDQDLLVTNMNGPARLLENRTQGGGEALDVILAPDALALTATVTAVTEERTLRRDLLAGRSYLTGVPMEVHFGLGSADVVEALHVRWADGVESEVGPVPAGRVVELRRCSVDEDCPEGGACEDALCPLRTVWVHGSPASELTEGPPPPAPSVDAGGPVGCDWYEAPSHDPVDAGEAGTPDGGVDGGASDARVGPGADASEMDAGEAHAPMVGAASCSAGGRGGMPSGAWAWVLMCLAWRSREAFARG